MQQPIIAKINDAEGVCLDGKWKAWLFRLAPNGEWVSVRKLETIDPPKPFWLR